MYRYSNKGVSKVISVLTIAVFLLTNTVYGAPTSRSLFKNKKVDYKKLSTQREERLRDKKSVLQNEDAAKKEQHKRHAKKVLSSHLEDLSQIHIPSELGRVTDVYQAPKDDSRLVVHIQDLHTNPEAQLNLASILELLLKDYKLGLVCSEGADGEVDTSSVSSFPNYRAREKTARIFINSGELTGEEYLSITKYPDLPIWGIEDRDIYFENIIEFNKIMKFSPQSQVFISQATKALLQLKPRVYSKELLGLDQKEADYENEKIETDEYLKHLSSYIQRFNILTSDYKNITLLSESMAQEKDIDRVKIMQESQNLLLNLQAALSSKSDRKSMDVLVVKAQLFKEQKISPFSFYSYLKALALRHVPDEVAKYPNLNEFIDYLINVNSLDTTKLFVEMEALTYEVKQRIASTEEQKTLIKALRNIKFLEGFFNLKVSNEELDYYLGNKESHKVSFFESFLKPALEKYNISLFIDYNPELIDVHLQGLEVFYKTVKARDVAMVKNSVSEIEKRNVKVSTLIAGGFHTKGITRLLREKGYSYIVVSPYSSTDIDEENYHFLLSGRRKSITQLMEQLDLPEIVTRLTSGLRVVLGFDKDLKAAWDEHVVPEISKIWGINEEELISGSIWERIGPVLALQKGAEKWREAVVQVEVVASNEEGSEVTVKFTPTYFPKTGNNAFQGDYYVRITPDSVRVLDDFRIFKAKKLASISKAKVLSNERLSETEIMDRLVAGLNESEKKRKIGAEDTLVLLGVFGRESQRIYLQPQYINITEEEVIKLLSIINEMFEKKELVGFHSALTDGMRELDKDARVPKDDFLSERLYKKFRPDESDTGINLASNEGLSEEEIMKRLVEELNESEKKRKIGAEDTLVLLGVFGREGLWIYLQPRYMGMTGKEVTELLSIINEMFEKKELVGFHSALTDGMRELDKDARVPKDDFLSERLYKKFRPDESDAGTSLVRNQGLSDIVIFSANYALHEYGKEKLKAYIGREGKIVVVVVTDKEQYELLETKEIKDIKGIIIKAAGDWINDPGVDLRESQKIDLDGKELDELNAALSRYGESQLSFLKEFKHINAKTVRVLASGV